MKKKYVLSGVILVTLSLFLKNTYSQEVIPNIYPYQPISFTNVKVEDQFWAPRIETNMKITIPHSFQKCEETGRIDNFAIAAGIKKGKFVGIEFDDSDVFKIIEGASYSLQLQYDPVLDSYLDSIIYLIAGAQEEDGYIYTCRTIDPQNINRNWSPSVGNQRWSNEGASNELYNVGHLYEAGVAHYLATKKKTLLNVAIKNADLISNIFGQGKIRLVPGHEVIEMGLVRLYRVTGNMKYLDMAKFFLDERGNIRGHKLFGANFQDDIPIVNQTKAVGHSVRAGYLYCGIADVGALTNDKAYIHTIDQIWENVVGTKLYLTGGIGSTRRGESFGEEYELPNETAYNETCAAIANAMWNYRMFLLHGQAKYIDVLERILYNGFLSGVSLEGDKFFYPNPLESKGDYKRQSWFTCACCPSNVVRFMPSIPGYIYAMKENDLYINLFIGSTVSVRIEGSEFKLKQETNYPWDGKVKLTVYSPKELTFKLYIRIPGWTMNQVVPSDLYTFSDKKSITPVSIKVNNKKVKYNINEGYAIIEKDWRNKDEIVIDIPMVVRRVAATEKVIADRGYEGYQRGPIVFCFEGIDNNGNALNAVVTDKNKIGYFFKPDLLKGVGVLQFMGQQVWKNKKSQMEEIKNTKLMAIPYYAWAHRGDSSMSVWIPSEKSILKK